MSRSLDLSFLDTPLLRTLALSLSLSLYTSFFLSTYYVYVQVVKRAFPKRTTKIRNRPWESLHLAELADASAKPPLD